MFNILDFNNEKMKEEIFELNGLEKKIEILSWETTKRLDRKIDFILYNNF